MSYSSYSWSRIKTIYPLLLLVFIDEMGNGLFFPLLAPMFLDPTQGLLPTTTSLTMRQIDYGIMLSIFPLMMFISAPLLGDLSDHYGRKKILILSLIGTAVGYVLCGLAMSYGSLTLMLFGRFVDGITAGNFPIAQAAIIDLSGPEEKTENLSLMIFMISMGFIVGQLLAGVLSNPLVASWFTLSTPLYAAAIISAINTGLILLTFRETFTPAISAEPFKLTKSVGLFLSAFREPHLRLLSCILFFLLLAWGSYIQYVSLFLYTEYHFTQTQLSCFMVVMACSFAFASTILIHFLTQRFANLPITLYMVIASLVGAILTVVTYQPLYAWLGLIPLSIGIAIAHTTVMALYSDEVDESRQGWVMGVSGAIVGLAILVSAAVNGLLANLSERLPIWLAVIFYAAAVVSIVIYQRQLRRNN